MLSGGGVNPNPLCCNNFELFYECKIENGKWKITLPLSIKNDMMTDDDSQHLSFRIGQKTLERKRVTYSGKSQAGRRYIW